MCRTEKRRERGPHRGAALLAFAALLATGGCASGKNANPAPSLTSPSSNVYAGTQSFFAQTFNNFSAPSYGGAWNVTIDRSSGYFSYVDFGFTAAVSNGFRAYWLNPLSGVETTAGGFLKLAPNDLDPTKQAAGVGGYALEVSGDTAVVRPGNSNIAPVIAVAANSCQTVKDAAYNFIALGTPFGKGSAALTDVPRVAYGSLTATTAGTTWNFSKFAMYLMDGTPLNPTALPAGGCSISQAGYTTTIPESAATNNLPYSLAVSPNGFFALDQGQGAENFYNTDRSQPGPEGPVGLVGVQQPTTPLDTGKLVAAKYLGFQFAPAQNYFGLAGTIMISFGQTPGSGTAMSGGSFVKDDPTQTIDSSLAAISLDLGQQDSATPGLYKSVTVTIPDRFGGCAQQSYGGVDANGLPTCTFTGLAVAGNPGGKYAIFVNVNDLGEQTLGGTPLASLHFFLYQQ